MAKYGPNFILFITDQQRADFLGCYGHPVLRTPNIDSIAMNGVTFDSFYVASPVCMPNRASLMTGRMPSSHGVRANGIPLAHHNVTFVELMRDAGYLTALMGKSHLQNFSGHPAILKPPGPTAGYYQPAAELREAIRHDLGGRRYQYEKPVAWSDRQPEVEVPFYGFDHVELVTGHGDAVGGHYVKWLLDKEPDAAELIGPERQLPHDYTCPQAVRTAVPEELYSTTFIAERAEAYIRTRQNQEQPFLLMVSFPDPHHPFNPPGSYWTMYEPEAMSTPAAFLRDDWIPPPHVREVIEARARGDAQLGGMRSIGITEREAREARALTCGMITMIDDAIGRILATLENSGLANDTVLVFTSDHGDHLGDHRLLLKGAEQYRDILRVPFIWSDPDCERRGRRTSAIGSTIDISATILHRARIMPCLGLQGRSALGVIEGHSDELRDGAYVQYDHQASNSALGTPPRIHSLVDNRWRLSMFRGATWGELYDLNDDPGEFNNLWDDSGAFRIRAELLERLLRQEIEHVDDVPLPTGLA